MYFVLFLLKAGILKLQRRAIDKQWTTSEDSVFSLDIRDFEESFVKLKFCKYDWTKEHLIVSEPEQTLVDF